MKYNTCYIVKSRIGTTMTVYKYVMRDEHHYESPKFWWRLWWWKTMFTKDWQLFMLLITVCWLDGGTKKNANAVYVIFILMIWQAIFICLYNTLVICEAENL